MRKERDGAVRLCKFDIGLVDYDDGLAREPLAHRDDDRAINQAAGRIVGRADEDDLDAFMPGSQYCIRVEGEIALLDPTFTQML